MKEVYTFQLLGKIDPKKVDTIGYKLYHKSDIQITEVERLKQLN